jgi:signal transduction histidine kinase
MLSNAGWRWSSEVVQLLFVVRVVVIGFAALMIEVCPVHTQEPTRRVLLLYPYNDTVPVTVAAGTGVRNRLVERYSSKIDIATEFLDLGRFPTDADELRQARYLAEKYAGRLPEVIVPMQSEALRFAVKYRGTIAPNVPIVFCCVTPNIATAVDRPKDVTGIYTQFDLGRTIALARQLQPAARNLVIVSGSTAFDQRYLASMRKEIEPHEKVLNTEYWIGVPYVSLLERASHVPRETIIVFVTDYDDSTGKTLFPYQVVEPLAQVASAPVYGPSDTYLGRGIVGGYMDSFELMGANAADMVLEVLAGKDPTTIEPLPSQNRKFQVDARQMQRWGLSERNLPKDAVMSFKQPTLWEEHRKLVLATVLVVFSQAILIAALIVQILRRRRAEAASHVARADLARVTRLNTIGEMTASIAHEINQPLGAIVTNSEAGLRWLGGATPDLGEVRAALTRIARNSHRASEVIGRIRTMLKKEIDERVLLDFNALVEEVLVFVRGEIDDHNIVVQTQLQRDLPKIFADRIQLQQVVLNLILNGIDAMASTGDRERRLKIRSEQDEHSTVMLLVEDAGKGIDTQIRDRIFETFFTTKAHGMGMGLSICRSIVASHGGRLLVSAAHPYGTVFQVELPVHRTGAA